MNFSVHLGLILLTMSFIPQMNFSYELQDTIHTLREENAYLHYRLKNLTQTLRELRKLLLDHSHGENNTSIGVCMHFSILFKEFFYSFLYFIKRVNLSTVSTVNHDSGKIHAWNEWIKNGKMAPLQHY